MCCDHGSKNRTKGFSWNAPSSRTPHLQPVLPIRSETACDRRTHRRQHPNLPPAYLPRPHRSPNRASMVQPSPHSQKQRPKTLPTLAVLPHRRTAPCLQHAIPSLEGLSVRKLNGKRQFRFLNRFLGRPLPRRNPNVVEIAASLIRLRESLL